jgi:hypothetical protein
MEYCCPCPASHGPLPQGQDVNHATPSGATVKRRLSKRPDIPPTPGEIARRGSWRDAANWNLDANKLLHKLEAAGTGLLSADYHRLSSANSGHSALRSIAVIGRRSSATSDQ